MKPKDKVFYYSIKIDFSKQKLEQEQKQYTVLGVNSTKLVIDDEAFTSLKHKKSYRGDDRELFNQVETCSSNFMPYWDYIQADLYTASSSKKIAYKRLKKALEKYIYEKHGRYCNAISYLDKIVI